MTERWADLFDRGASYDVSRAEVRAELESLRADDGGDGDD